MKINKDLVITVLTFLGMWVFFNIAWVGFTLFDGGNVFGETSFWNAFYTSFVIEIVIVSILTVFIAVMYWVFKGMVKQKKK